MTNLSMYCLTLKPEHEKKISDLKYIPVGLGKEKFSKNFLRINQVKLYLKKIHIMVSILFIIGFGKIT